MQRFLEKLVRQAEHRPSPPPPVNEHTSNASRVNETINAAKESEKGGKPNIDEDSKSLFAGTQSKQRWVRCDQGYGILADTTDTISKVRLDWGVVYAPTKSLDFTTSITCCTFLDDKPSFPISAHLNDTFKSIKQQISDHFALPYANIRLICDGHELTPAADDVALGSCNLSNAHQVILFCILDEKFKFTLDPDAKSGAIILSDGLLTATVSDKANDGDCTVRAKRQFSSGKVFWDVKLITCASGKMNIGVGTRNCTFHSYCGSSDQGWSYHGSTGKFEHGGGGKESLERFTSGDTIRVKLDMDSRTVGFCKNGKDMKSAFHDLPDSLYPTFSMYQRGDSFSITNFGTF